MPVGIFELAHGSLNTEPSFEQRLGIPLTALFIEEIAAIDMDGAGEPSDRVCNRMDDVVPEWLRGGRSRSTVRDIDTEGLIVDLSGS
jgi:hypothetical protein